MTIGVLGLTFKAGTDDLRDSTSVAIVNSLLANGATVQVYDPTVEQVPTGRKADVLAGVTIVSEPLAAATDASVLVIATEWPEFAELDLDKVAGVMTPNDEGPAVIVDTRNLLDPAAVRAAGLGYEGVGRGRELRTMARVVVTEAPGSLGSHLCRALLDRGDDVVAIDNFVTGTVANVEGLFGRRGFTLSNTTSAILWVPGDVDVVMHLASPASPIDFERIPIQILKVGGLGTHNGLGLAKAKGATFFLASTSEVYGDPLVHPQPETYWGNVNPIGPRGVYDEAKRYAEAMTTAYHRHHHLDVRIVRIFNSILADEQVLYDDGVELRRERIGDLADRIGHEIALTSYSVPAFDAAGRIRVWRGHGPRRACSDWPGASR